MLRRRGILLSYDASNLRDYVLLGHLVGAHEVEGTDTFTVETHDLGEGLRDAHLEALVQEVSKAKSILIHAARSEALVCGVKEGIKLIALANLGNFLPLVLSWVDTSGVVGAGVEQDD